MIIEFTESDGGAISAVKAGVRLENAAGVEPSSSEIKSVAKTSDDNGEISGTIAALMAGEVSRPGVGRSASATSEIKDVTVGGDERGTVANSPSLATECAAPTRKAAVDEGNVVSASLPSSTSTLDEILDDLASITSRSKGPDADAQVVIEHRQTMEEILLEQSRRPVLRPAPRKSDRYESGRAA